MNLLVIDECHCVSEHGNTFRPAYRTLRDNIPVGPDVVTVALTATATTLVHDDVVATLRLRPNLLVVQQTMYRPNLHVNVVAHSLRPVDVVRPPTGRTLIYALTRKRCDQLSLLLTKQGIDATSYHAGLEPAERQERAEHFRLSTRRPVLVATICYGMGMDVPDIRLVLHDGLPKSILGYVQEVGRGGRDGQNSTCRLFFDSCVDMIKHKRLMSTQEELTHLRTMLAWAQNLTECRTQALLRIFGETEASTCGTCDVCTTPMIEEDREEFMSSQDVNLLLQALRQTGNHHGRGVPVDFLLGSKKKNIRFLAERYQESDSVYGKGQYQSREDWIVLHKKTVHHQGIREICTRHGYIIFKTRDEI
jgi:ATP-dependent DNA helicase RecQ